MLYVTALLLLAAHTVSGNRPFGSCTMDCGRNCLKCTSKVLDGDNYIVNLDFSTCKGKGDPIDRMCCRTDMCEVLSCDSGSKQDSRCQQVKTAIVSVPVSTQSIIIQTYDAKQFGSVQCANGACCVETTSVACGGSSGVCNHVVDLNDCETDFQRRGGRACIEDGDCSLSQNKECSRALCDNGRCVMQAKSPFTICRPSVSECDVPEYCDGRSFQCPPDAYQSNKFVCREYEDECDTAEKCRPNSPFCPIDSRIPGCSL
jgi:hypothetical protein